MFSPSCFRPDLDQSLSETLAKEFWEVRLSDMAIGVSTLM